MLACHAGDAVYDVQVEVGDPSTLLHISWQTDAAVQGRVQAHGVTTPWTPAGTEHRVTVLGLTPDTELSPEIELDSGERVALGPVSTGSLPLGLPELEVEGTLDGRFVLVPLLGNVVGPAIIDGEGRFVWWHLVSDEDAAVYRAWWSRDGAAVLYGALHASEVRRVPLAGGLVLSTPFPTLGHDFLELPDGAFAGISHDVRAVGGVTLTGDAIVEVRDGAATEIWNAWDHFEPDEGALSGAEALQHWTHANALDHLEDDDAYVLNLLRRQALVKVGRAGQIAWVLSGDADNDFAFTEGTEPPGAKHQFQIEGDEITWFHNRAADEPSSVDRLRLDQGALEVEALWSYTADPAVSALVLGDVSVRESGTVHSTWGSAGVMRQLSPERETTWLLEAPVGTAFGYSEVLDGLYPE